MTVSILLFASYAEALGASTLALEVSPGATVRDVVDRVRGLTGGARLPRDVVVAVNECYATSDQVVGSGDEIALIPPVAGG
jgi:molybdopterin converting factor subunit 1